MKKPLIFFLITVSLLGGVLFAFSALKQTVEKGEIRARTEERLGKILGAKVSIGKVQLKFLRRLSFSELKFAPGRLGPHLALIQVEKIIFGYSWRSLFERNLRSPRDVLFENPKFRLDAFDAGLLYQWSFLGLAGGNVPFSAKIEDGAIEWNDKAGGEKSGLEHLSGRVEKRSPVEVSLRFKGNFTGAVRGEIAWEGKVALKTKRADLVVRLKDVEHVSRGLTLFHHLNGTLRLKDSTLFIDRLHFFVSSLDFEVNGKIENVHDPDPKFHLEIKENSKISGGSSSLALDGDFKTQKIWGSFLGFGGNFPVRGDLLRDPAGWSIRNMRIGGEILSEMVFIRTDWTMRLKFTRGKERYDARFALRDFRAGLDIHVDHFQLYDFDIVTSAHVELAPVAQSWNLGNFVFDASLSTDYFVFDYAPLADLKGDFRLSGEGFRELRLEWGSGYKMTGEILFGRPPLVALDIQAKNIVLSETSRFGFHELPRNLTGMMDGKIKIRGEAKQPEISGHLSIGSGSVKELTFDHLLLNFFGNRHYLKLKDSKISRGARNFYVKGDVDFGNKNIFSGVEVISEDHLPVWSGKDMRMEALGSPSQPVTEKKIAQIERNF